MQGSLYYHFVWIVWERSDVDFLFPIVAFATDEQGLIVLFSFAFLIIHQQSTHIVLHWEVLHHIKNVSILQHNVIKIVIKLLTVLYCAIATLKMTILILITLYCKIVI